VANPAPDSARTPFSQARPKMSVAMKKSPLVAR
jgi:hypothetical protein